jgi:hypothetical protein
MLGFVAGFVLGVLSMGSLLALLLWLRALEIDAEELSETIIKRDMGLIGSISSVPPVLTPNP